MVNGKIQRIKSRRNNGMVIYYMTAAMFLMCGFCSFAVDLGRVHVTKTEMQCAADTRRTCAAAAELPDVNSAIAFATQYAKSNTSDGTPVVIDPSSDIEFGKWDAKKSKFTKLTGNGVQNANCVHVMLRRTAKRGTAVPLLFGKVIGSANCDVNVESYAMPSPAWT